MKFSTLNEAFSFASASTESGSGQQSYMISRCEWGFYWLNPMNEAFRNIPLSRQIVGFIR